MHYKIIDAHSHLWLRQDTVVDGQIIRTTDKGRSIFFGEERQMLPPFMIDGRNTAEIFLANMDYAQVSAAVVTQEFIDGEQNEYLAEVVRKYPDRFKVCGMADFTRPGFLAKVKNLLYEGFSAIAIPGHRLPAEMRLNCDEMMEMFKFMEERGDILSLCLSPDDPAQIEETREVIVECPNLKIAIGHFGMVTTPKWKDQIRLAEARNVMIESGGITWLFNDEFYPFKGAVRAIKQAADTVGIDKLMWGSDYPRTITAITYRMSYDFIVKSCELEEDEKRKFLGENAKDFYGFGSLIELPYIRNMSE